MHETKIPVIINDQIYEATTREIQCKTKPQSNQRKKKYIVQQSNILLFVSLILSKFDISLIHFFVFVSRDRKLLW